jgi:hypothetical protein
VIVSCKRRRNWIPVVSPIDEVFVAEFFCQSPPKIKLRYWHTGCPTIAVHARTQSSKERKQDEDRGFGLHPPLAYCGEDTKRNFMHAKRQPETTHVIEATIGHLRERQKVGGPVLATIGRRPRRTTGGINCLKGSVADLLQPAILRPPTFWRSPPPEKVGEST